MNQKYPHGIGPVGYWLIFLGVPWLAGAILTCTWRLLLHIVGEQALPYILFFAPVSVGIVCMILYNYLPRQLMILIGVVAWMLTFSLLYWYFWFGPGAIGHH